MASSTPHPPPLTLTIQVNTAPWTPAMDKMYRFLCAPTNVQFMREAVAVAPTLTDAEHDTVAIRVANTPGLDIAASIAFFEKIGAQINAKKKNNNNAKD